MKTVLCETCKFSWIIGAEDFEGNVVKTCKCFLSNGYIDHVVECNRYKKSQVKTTYHDPDWEAYEEKVKKEWEEKHTKK